MGTSRMEEGRRSQRRIDTRKLRMVEKVVVLPAEIERLVFSDRETFKQTEIEVQAARGVQSVTPHIAEGQAPGCCKGRWIKEERPEQDRKSTRLNSSHTVISY